MKSLDILFFIATHRVESTKSRNKDSKIQRNKKELQFVFVDG